MSALTLLLADDHTLMRHGLRKILEAQPGWRVIAEAADGREAVRLAIDLKPDVVVLDVAMPLLNGIEAARQITRRLPASGVLILSMHADEAFVTRALEAGVRGYVLKDAASTELIQAVHAIAAGRAYFGPVVAEVMRDQYVRSLAERGIADRFDALSEREREVFQLIVEGHSSKEIANLLHVSPATVETHRTRIMEKLDLHSAADVVRYAARRGWVR